LSQVSIGTDGTLFGLYGTAGTNNIYRNNGSSWYVIPGGLHQVSVGDATHIVGQYNGQPMYYNPSTQTWINIAKPNGSNVTDIEVGADGTIYAISSEWPNNLYRMDWATATCVAITGNLTVDGPTSFCADADATYTILIGQQNVTDYIWEYNGASGTLVGGSVTITAPPSGQASPLLTIYGSNACSQGSAFTYTPSIVGVPAPFIINGSVSTCVGSLVAYNIEATAMTTTWEFPTAWVQNTTAPNNNGGQFTAGESGTISFTRDNGCATRTEALEVMVFQGPPAPAVLVSGGTMLCKDEPMLFSFQPDVNSLFNQMTYGLLNTWTATPDTDTSIYITATGWWTNPITSLVCVSTNACGQTNSAPLSLTTNGNQPSVGSYWQQNGEVLECSGSLSTHTFQWLLEGNPIPGATGLTYTPLVSGNYALETTMTDFPCPPYVTDSQ